MRIGVVRLIDHGHLPNLWHPRQIWPSTVLDLHGGAWNAKDRKAEEPMDRAIAESGGLSSPST
jgi:hypothetical protein